MLSKLLSRLQTKITTRNHPTGITAAGFCALPFEALMRKEPSSVKPLKAKSTTGRVCPGHVKGTWRAMRSKIESKIKRKRESGPCSPHRSKRRKGINKKEGDSEKNEYTSWLYQKEIANYLVFGLQLSRILWKRKKDRITMTGQIRLHRQLQESRTVVKRQQAATSSFLSPALALHMLTAVMQTFLSSFRPEIKCALYITARKCASAYSAIAVTTGTNPVDLTPR